LRCWRAGAQVTISYRQSTFAPDLIKRHLLDDILARIERNEITFLPSTVPVEITPTHVVLAPAENGAPNGSSIEHKADFVLLMLGFAADASLLASAGVTILGEEQMPFHDPKTMETNVPGLFVAGTAVGGTQWRLKHAIYTSHNHVTRIVKAITGQVPRRLGTAEPRNSDISWEEIRANS
jgi:thioredoxin reductase (NADPH)